MKTIKIIIISLCILLGFPAITLGGSMTLSLINGKTPTEAIEILATQIDGLLGRTAAIEEKQKDTDSDLENIKAENEKLKQQLQQTQQQVDTNKLCEELKQSGPRRITTKQPIKELYENLLKQNGQSFEQAYADHVAGGAKVMSREDFKVQWDQDRASMTEWILELKPYYDEYIAKCQ